MTHLKRLGSRELYTVGWITALNIELIAAIQMLDERHDSPSDFTKGPTDPNVYVWGKIRSHNVVIASLEAGAYGIAPAATTATNMLASFPNVKVGLLVGIGAGIRRGKWDVRLGDFVISQPDGKSGGVYQYDLRKAKSGNQSESIGILNRPSTLLLKVLNLVQAHHQANPSKVTENLKRITQNMANPPDGSPGYVHQGSENDRLFKSSFNHVLASSSTGGEAAEFDEFDFDDPAEPSSTCSNCPKEHEVIRRERLSGTSPQFHYGTIASGNTLIKDAAERNKIAKLVGENCICFEMEAAGLMNNFPCLVIRGICDYADSHKNDQWQRYAALTAAAYAREFLEFVPEADMTREKPLVEQVEASLCTRPPPYSK